MDATAPLRAARPLALRAAAATGIAIAALVTSSAFGGVRNVRPGRAITTGGIVALACFGAGVVAGVVAVRYAARALQAAAELKIGVARAATLRFVAAVVGYVILFFTALPLAGANVGGLLVGGAVTGVVVGIAAQQTLANFFAGLVLLGIRPFSIGDDIVLRSGPLGGEFAGTVTEMTLYYVHLATEDGPVQLPNAGVLAAAIGPGARKPPDVPPEHAAEEAGRAPGPGAGPGSTLGRGSF